MDKDILKQIYKEYKIVKNIKILANKYKIDHSYLCKELKKFGFNLFPKGIANRKWTFNENYFDIIDSQEKAYFLGFLWADGNNSGKGCISLKLSEKDKIILEKFKSLIRSSRPLRRISNITCTKNNKKYSCKDAYILIINSVLFGDKLNKMGFVPNKTKSLRLPQNIIPQSLFHHFIRGFFDGDGSLPKTIAKNRKKPSIVFELSCKNLELALELKTLFSKYTGINLSIRSSGSIYKIYSVNRKNILIILDWMYKDAFIKLERKYNRYQELNKLEKEWSVKRTSKYKGVSFNKKSKKWIVRKTINNKTILIGCFDSEEKAFLATQAYIKRPETDKKV